MLPLTFLLLSTVISDCLTKPTTESTHSILQRLGFDQVQKPVVNHHRKRVAQELSKARHHIDGYNTETDSHMFVVKLPPHYPYYSHTKPEKIEKNEVLSKSAANFRTNGKPAGVYHWNIPVLRRLPQVRVGASRIAQGQDSKVYHVKILPNEYGKEGRKPGYKKPGLSKVKKQRYEERTDKLKASRNSVRVYSLKNRKESGKKGTVSVAGKVKSTKSEDLNESLVRDAATAKDKRQRGPSFYQPALPKHNSFHRDFTGNGKPKSFYVIDKTNKASRYHRLF